MSKKIELRRKVELTEAATILEDLIASLKAGTVCVQKGADYVTVTPVGDIELEIEAKQKKDKEGISIDLSWKVKEDLPEELIESFCISATEPMMPGDNEVEAAE